MIDSVVADWPAPANVRALTTTRAGGTSQGPYASLNLGLHVGDDEQRVRRNRSLLADAFGLPGAPVWLEQVHGTTVVELAANLPQSQPPIPADAAWTRAAGVVCCIMTADCLPVLLCDSSGTRVGVVHAGWRGLAAGVIAAAVAAMRADFSGRFMAWLGPAISQAAYEVGPQVRAACSARDPDAAAAFAPNSNGRWQADLYAVARRQLNRLGIADVYGGQFCTHRDASRFFSHRREAPCGRMASLIWLQSA